MNALTGKIECQVPATGTNPLNASLSAGATGQMSAANGIVFAPSHSGDMVALDAETGKMLWKFASGGSVVDGSSIVDGIVYWGSGYGQFGIGKGNNKLYAFALPGGPATTILNLDPWLRKNKLRRRDGAFKRNIALAS